MILLRPVIDSDLPIFFEQQLDDDANRMAAFTAKDPADRAAFDTHWTKIQGADGVMNRTIMVDGDVAGYVAKFEQEEGAEVCYWIGNGFWGQGIATAALTALLREVETRPIHAAVAKDNVASLRVLEKCRFVIRGEGKGFANARGEEVEEYILVLEA